MDSVNVEHEFVWYCPKCKARNIADTVVAELSPYEKQELWEDHGLKCSTGDFMSVEPFVTCAECEETFETRGGLDHD
jgi:hypothetical protein